MSLASIPPSAAPRVVLLLRGINLGAHRRVAMAALRELLAENGHPDVATHLQSGNVVFASDAPTPALETEVAALLQARFGFEIPVLARTGAEITAVLAHDPIPGAAADPKRYQVTFLLKPPTDEALAGLRALALGEERLLAHGRELYTWHPEGIARSSLALSLTAAKLGLSATARNWTTVTRLAEMTAG